MKKTRWLYLSIVVAFTSLGFVSTCEKLYPSKTPPSLDTEPFFKVGKNAKSLNQYLLSQKNRQTDVALVKVGQEIIYEYYERKELENKRMLAWSIGKSVFNLMIGRLVDKNIINMDMEVCPLLKNSTFAKSAKNSKICKNDLLKLKHLASFSSAIDWRENYEEDGNPGQSSVQTMLFADGVEDGVIKHVLKHDYLPNKGPGDLMSYSSGDSILLSGAIQSGFKKEYDQLLRDFNGKLETEINFGRSVWNEKAEQSVLVSSSFLHIKPMDLLKIGNLILNQGKSNDQQIVSKQWLNKLFTPYKSQENMVVPSPATIGLGWYVNKSVDANNIAKPWPFLPAGAVAALGHWGQILLVVPSWDLVAVRFGFDLDKKAGSMRAGEFGWAIGRQIGKIPLTDVEPIFSKSSMDSAKNIFDRKHFSNFKSRAPIALGAVGSGVASYLGCACHFIAEMPFDYCAARVNKIDPVLSIKKGPWPNTVTGKVTKFMLPIDSMVAAFDKKTDSSRDHCIMEGGGF